MTPSSPPAPDHPTDRLVGTSPALATLRAQIRHLVTFDGGPTAPTLLLQGETGTGKSLVARVIHDSGPRAAGPFVAVNCSALPETMLEAELFGFEAGAFTDAKRAKPGLCEAAAHGTLLLDEIEALPLVLQAKLLTVLETKQVRRLGAVKDTTVDCKLIAATNAWLPEQVAAGRFRADLYHRLAVVVLTLPPLRERGDDVLGLAQTRLQALAAMHGVAPKRVTAAAAAWLRGYAWPGNVRELSHLLERVTLLHVGAEVDVPTLVELSLRLSPPPDASATPPPPATAALDEATQMRQALVQAGGNVVRAAQQLGLSRDTLRYRMARSGIPRRPGEDAPPRAGLPPPAPPAPAPLSPLVGRESVVQRLHTALTQAQQGTPQVVFVTGEAGIGKTTVVEAFLAQTGAATPCWMARGQCVEHYGPGEAYLPVLEALAQLCRGPHGAHLVALLRHDAPTWLVQMPWLLAPTDRVQLQHELQGTTRERMLRELAQGVETLTTETPLVLVLEDLHWSDFATLDLVAWLARRQQTARLLLLGTYRPAEALVADHPVRRVVQAVQQHGQGMALPLTGLGHTEVAAYLAVRFPRHQFPVGLAARLQQWTDGHPLFLRSVLAAWIEQGALVEREGCWTLQGPLEALALEVPTDLQQMLEQQLERVSVDEQQVLAGASVVGVEFTVAAVAAGLEAEALPIETCCDGLVRRQHLLRPAGVVTWPDGTLTARYAFVHALYQQVAYARLGAAWRLAVHQRLGRRLEAAYGPQAGEIAAELAMHCERGRDLPRAIQYSQLAAANAVRRQAYHEATALLSTSVALLHSLPDTPARAQQELRLQSRLGAAAMTTHGYLAPQVETAYARAFALYHQVGGDPTELLPVLVGLRTVALIRGDLQRADAFGEQCLRVAPQTHNPAARLWAHVVVGETLGWRGDVVAARRHLEQGLALAASQPPAALRVHRTNHPQVLCLALAALVWWFLGYPVQADAWSQEALTLAQALALPLSLAYALRAAAMLHQLRRDSGAAGEAATRLMALATEQDFAYWLVAGSSVQGWVLTATGHPAEGLALLQQALTAYQASGAALQQTPMLVPVIQAYQSGGQVDQGLAALAEAMAAVDTTNVRLYEAELYRLKGELLLAQAPARDAEAEGCLQQALAVARHQQAKSWELRAAMSLSRLWQRQGQRAAARELLAPLYGWFTEGFDTADLQEAKALLEALA